MKIRNIEDFDEMAAMVAIYNLSRAYGDALRIEFSILKGEKSFLADRAVKELDTMADGFRRIADRIREKTRN